jgi:hypothetical protein
MMQRCFNPNATGYRYYGGRDIRPCEAWCDFANFYAYVDDAPPGKTLDRIDNNRGYEPGNVKWSTPREQLLNRRPYKRKKRRRSTLAEIQAYAAALARAASASPTQGEQQ